MMLMSSKINFHKLTDDNFLMFAMQNYENPQCISVEDFNEDLMRIKYIKRLLNRHKESGELKERLILNHIIVLYNVFGVEACTKMLFFKIEQDLWSKLKTFLVFLHYMPEKIYGISDNPIISSDIPLDQNIVKVLREI